MSRIFLLASLFLSAACRPDDVSNDTGSGKETTDGADGTSGDDTGGTDGGGGDGGGTGALIAGSWLSTGDDVSPLFSKRPFNYVEITANFEVDGSYLVHVLDESGQEADLEGTYVADDSTTPSSIVLTQATPYAATAEGIYQVDGDTLTYEVVQTQPDYGFLPPTPETGFGTTSGSGLNPGDNTQIYRRQ